jgi:hypothetical protein
MSRKEWWFIKFASTFRVLMIFVTRRLPNPDLLLRSTCVHGKYAFVYLSTFSSPFFFKATSSHETDLNQISFSLKIIWVDLKRFFVERMCWMSDINDDWTTAVIIVLSYIVCIFLIILYRWYRPCELLHKKLYPLLQKKKEAKMPINLASYWAQWCMPKVNIYVCSIITFEQLMIGEVKVYISLSNMRHLYLILREIVAAQLNSMSMCWCHKHLDLLFVRIRSSDVFELFRDTVVLFVSPDRSGRTMVS